MPRVRSQARPEHCLWREGCELKLAPGGNGISVRDLPHGYSLHAGRGLCTQHHDQARRAGILDQYPPLTRSSAEVAAAVAEIRAENPKATWAQIAAECGMTADAAEQAVRRATRARATPPRSRPVPPARSGWVHTSPKFFDPNTLDEGEEP